MTSGDTRLALAGGASTTMTEEHSIIPIDNPEQSAWGIIGRSLGEYNRQQAGPDNAQRICYVVQTPDGEIAGGVIAVTYWDWLYIDLMWLREDLRGRGYGSRLLALAEEAGRHHGATHAHLDTFSFQAPDFYARHGYHVFGELPDFPAGHRRYYLTKEL